jgi:hypothetical protein
MTVDRKLRLRLALIAALPEPILLERLRRLSVAELIVFRRRYGIRECRCRSRCKIRQFLHDGTKLLAAVGVSRRLALRQLAALRDDCPSSMFQSRCACEASRQGVLPIPVLGPSTLGQAVGARRGIRAAPALQAQDQAESARCLRPKPGDSARSTGRCER